MCYNCGCGSSTDDMGRGRVTEGGEALTNDDFKKLADAWGMPLEEAKKNTYLLLKQEFEKKK